MSINLYEKFTCEIKCRGAAFEVTPASELARILRDIADKLENDGPSGYLTTIRDVNGNDCGRWAVKPVF